MTGYSQYGEDQWIAENLIPDRGVFCEVGAYDGRAGSNTLLFEESGWSGICIEPVPELAAKCRTNRKAVTWCCAIGESGLKPFYLYPNDMGRGGLEVKGAPFPVVVCPLWDIIMASGLGPVDLLSLDTEGTEIECFYSLGVMRPKIIIMEYRTGEAPPVDKEIVSKLRRFHYREVHRTFANLIFVHD